MKASEGKAALAPFTVEAFYRVHATESDSPSSAGSKMEGGGGARSSLLTLTHRDEPFVFAVNVA